MKNALVTLLATSVPWVTATTTTTTPPASATLQACALVSSSSAVQAAASPSATPTVAAQLARDCLDSDPLNKTAALQLVESLVPYIEWQSDTAWKKKPPADYFYPPHDIFGYLASVRTSLEADTYASEYEFQEDLYQVFVRAHDGHFVFYPVALTKAFNWGRQRSLVSISEDGTSLPVIKLYEDVVSSPSTASAVSQINGVEASKYVADFVLAASFNQDPDAAYNSMFNSKAFRVSGVNDGGYFAGDGCIRYIYPGSHTTFGFANGTTRVIENIAYIKESFDAVTDGASFYARFCSGPLPETTDGGTEEEESPTIPTVPLVAAPGYPGPLFVTSEAYASGVVEPRLTVE